LLSHHRDQAAQLTTVALDNRREFGALGDRHADTFDNNVADLVGPVFGHQTPVNPHRGSGTWASYVSRHDNAIAVAPTAADFQSLASEIRKSCRVHENNVVFEQLNEFLLLLLTRRAPVAAKYESSDPGTIKIFVEQLAETRPPSGGICLIVEDFDGAVPKLVH